jgi:hypothetical protein
MTCGTPTTGAFCSPECRAAGTKGALAFRARRKKSIPDEAAYVQKIRDNAEKWRSTE